MVSDGPTARGAHARGRPLAILVSGLVSLLASGFAVGAGLALAGVLFLSAGLSLGPFLPAAEGMVAERTDAPARLGGASLRLAGRDLRLALSELSGGPAEGRAEALGVVLDLSPRALMRGDALPRVVTAEGTTISLVRTETGLRLGSGREGGGQGGSQGGGLGRLTDRLALRGFERAEVTGAALTVLDERSGRTARLDGIALTLTPAEAGGYRARAALPIGEGRVDVDASLGGALAARLSVRDVPAAALAALLGRGEVSGEVRLSGEASLADGAVLFSLGASPGALRLGERALRLAEGTVRGRYALDGRVLTIEESVLSLGPGSSEAGAERTSRARLAGSVTLDGAPRFDLRAEEVTLWVGEDAPPWRLAAITAAGGYEAAPAALRVDAATLRPAEGAPFSGALTVLLPRDGVGIGVTGSLEAEAPMPVAAALDLWPPHLSRGARRWVTGRLDEGTATALRLDADVPRGTLDGGRRVAPGMIDLAFAIEEADLLYADGLPPAVGTTVRGAIGPDGLTVTAVGGRTGGARIDAARFALPIFAEGDPPADITAALSGPAEALAGLADAPRFGFLGQAGLSPSGVAGEARFALSLRRPLRDGVPPEAITLTGEGDFTGLSLEGLPSGLELTEADGTITLADGTLTIAADGRVQDVPAAGTFTLSPRGPDLPPTLLLVADAALTPRDLGAFGLPARRVMRGAAPTRLVAEGQGRFETARLDLNLTPTAIDAPGDALDKAAGVRGAAALTFRLAQGASPAVETLRLTTDDVLIEGSARLGPAGGIEAIDLPRVFVEDAADLSARLVRREGGLHLTASGAYLDAAGLIASGLRGGGSNEGGEGGLPAGLSAAVALDQLGLRGGVHLDGFTAEAEALGTPLSRAAVGGAFPGGGALSLTLAPDGQGVGRDLSLTTDSFGQVLTGLFGITSVTAGEAALTATLIEDGPVAGGFEAEGIVLRDAPLVARLLSVGSLTGLADVMNGEGIAFDRLAGEVTLRDGVMSLRGARMTGPALGLSAEGAVDLKARRFDVSGAVAPAYGVNSILGAVPLLGDLLVGREGEGVVAFAYGVEGPIGAPRVSVNTLSALTPGILRRVFEPIRPRQRSTAEILAEADEAARRREDTVTASSAEELEAADVLMRREAAEPSRGDGRSRR